MRIDFPQPVGIGAHEIRIAPRTRHQRIAGRVQSPSGDAQPYAVAFRFGAHQQFGILVAVADRHPPRDGDAQPMRQPHDRGNRGDRKGRPRRAPRLRIQRGQAVVGVDQMPIGVEPRGLYRDGVRAHAMPR